MNFDGMNDRQKGTDETANQDTYREESDISGEKGGSVPKDYEQPIKRDEEFEDQNSNTDA